LPVLNGELWLPILLSVVLVLHYRAAPAVPYKFRSQKKFVLSLDKYIIFSVVKAWPIPWLVPGVNNHSGCVLICYGNLGGCGQAAALKL
jgi:hypothetical protein